MAKFRKLPVVIEAVQYSAAEHYPSTAAKAETAKALGLCYANVHDNYVVDTPHIHTLEGMHHVSEGDWIITGIKGEHYPCKPDIFKLTYEPVD